MTLQNFQPKARITGDKMDLRNYFGRPLLVRVNEYVPDFASQAFPNPKPVVFVDVVDLAQGQIFINALWGGGAVVDNLKEHAGTDVVLPLMAQNAVGGNNRNYIALTALDDATAAAAGQWYQQNWATVEQTRQQRMAQAQAAQPQQTVNPVNQQGAVQFQNQPQNQGPGFGDPQGNQLQQPQQGFGQPQQNQFQPGTMNPAAQPLQPQGQPNQFQQPAAQPQQGFGQPQGQPNQFQQPAQQFPAQAPQQGFAAPQGMFSDQMPPVQPGQGFAAPQGTDPAAANAALQQLNGQLGG